MTRLAARDICRAWNKGRSRHDRYWAMPKKIVFKMMEVRDAERDAKSESLRALIKEMADKLHSEHCCDDGSHFDGCDITDVCHSAETCALVAKAREVVK